MATEINRLIKSLLQVQQDREDKSVIMRVSNVRVTRVDCSPYYGTVVFSGGAMAIEADDLKTGDRVSRRSSESTSESSASSSDKATQSSTATASTSSKKR